MVATLLLAIGLTVSWPAAAESLADCIVAYDAGMHVEAVSCLRRHAEVGNAAAQNWLGLLYARGHGVVSDPVTAAAWYQRAAGPISLTPEWSGCSQEIF